MDLGGQPHYLNCDEALYTHKDGFCHPQRIRLVPSAFDKTQGWHNPASQMGVAESMFDVSNKT